jgi:hypothetical protein
MLRQSQFNIGDLQLSTMRTRNHVNSLSPHNILSYYNCWQWELIIMSIVYHHIIQGWFWFENEITENQLK